MKNLKSKFAIGIVCIILGIILTIQYKTVNKTVGKGYLPTQKSKELSLELKKLQDKKEKLNNELSNLESRIKKYEDEASEENVYINELKKELEKYKIFAGYLDVKGPGIIITIDEPSVDIAYGDDLSYDNGYSLIVEYYDYILTIISNLNIAEAEAISINDLRYTGFSELLSIGNHLSFNGISIGAPIEIKAIGNPEELESALIYKGGILDIMENELDFRINIRRQENIKIPGYKGLKELRYIKPVKKNK